MSDNKIVKPNIKELEDVFEKDLDLMLFYLTWIKNGLKETRRMIGEAYKQWALTHTATWETDNLIHDLMGNPSKPLKLAKYFMTKDEEEYQKAWDEGFVAGHKLGYRKGYRSGRRYYEARFNIDKNETVTKRNGLKGR